MTQAQANKIKTRVEDKQFRGVQTELLLNDFT